MHLHKDKLQVGDKVYYHPDHDKSICENGIIKEIPASTNQYVRVVYYCNNNWDNYKDYTGALTNLGNLTFGWK